MEGNLTILEGKFDWVPGKKRIFSSREYVSQTKYSSFLDTLYVSPDTESNLHVM